VLLAHDSAIGSRFGSALPASLPGLTRQSMMTRRGREP
jgi:hypothetical protein